ncbi:MAG TPA: L-lactate dehydrogenase [Clostridiaceae bacterium]|jgi:L-lactate dehydrogenase|nr:L-lactate dehydrogenase [Clostridiaceae bacterium]
MIENDINKVTIVGTGFVGSTTAYTLMLNGLISELVLIDINATKAKGEAMDLNHGLPFAKPVKIYQGTYEDSRDSDLVIITAGANQKVGETRIDLVHKNTAVFRDIISQIIKYNSPENTLILVVTNPVDILTYVTWKLSGFPVNRVLGSGTVLDTARFKYLIGEHVGVDARNVHGYILGEHGDTELPAWSLTTIAGMPMDVYCSTCKSCNDHQNRDEIFNKVKNAAYEIINAKGATYYAVALAVERIVEAIIRNEHSILTVSSILQGQYGISDVALSVPTLVDRNGVNKVLEVPLTEEEQKLLHHSANSLKEIIKDLGI